MSERPKYIPPTIFDICESSDVLNYMGYHEYFDLIYKQDRNLIKYNGDTPLIVLMDSEFYKKFEYFYIEKDKEARKLKLRLVPYLVKRSGIPVNHKNKKGFTALMRAIILSRGEDVELFKLLIENGADPNIKDEKGHNAVFQLYTPGYPHHLLKPAYDLFMKYIKNPKEKVKLSVLKSEGKYHGEEDEFKDVDIDAYELPKYLGFHD